MRTARTIGTALFGLGVFLGAAAEVPSLMTYQGRLTTATGSPITTPTTLRFRVLQGGTADESPSTGTLVYAEAVRLTPSATGSVSHLIGSGTPQPGCAEGLCALTGADFDAGTQPVWIEVTVDADGLPGNADDDLLLPRIRFGTVGYAFRVQSLEGATAGRIVGTLAAGTIESDGGVTTHDGIAFTPNAPGSESTVLVAETPTSNRSITLPNESGTVLLDAGAQTVTGEKTFAGVTTFSNTTHTVPGKSQMTGTVNPATFPMTGATIRHYFWEPIDQGCDYNNDGASDSEAIWIGPCYNCAEGTGNLRDNPADYLLGFQFTGGWTSCGPPAARYAEWFFRHVTIDGVEWYPIRFNMLNANAATPTSEWTSNATPNKIAYNWNANGFAVGGYLIGRGELEVHGQGSLYLKSRLLFEGSTYDAYTTTLSVVNPTAVRTIQLPDTSGVVSLTSADEQLTGQKTLTQSIRLSGGDWNAAHVQLGSAHLWYDATSGVPRIAAAAPTSPSSGSGLMTVASPAARVEARCGTVTMTAPSAPPRTTVTATAAVAGLADGDRCVCSARADFDDDVLPKDCLGSADQLNLRLYNTANGALDLAPQSVDYCCFR